MSPLEMVQEFHRVFNCSVDDLSMQTAESRLNLVEEEYTEMLDEVIDFYPDIVGVDREGSPVFPIKKPEDWDRKALAKEMADLVYVLYGSALAWGIDLDKAVEIVHTSNMSKVWEDGKPRYREGDGKVLKPPTYQKPDMREAVKDL